jgi:hypothetical protein
MRTGRSVLALAITYCTLFDAAQASAQSVRDPAKWAIDFGAGLSPSINGNVNSVPMASHRAEEATLDASSRISALARPTSARTMSWRLPKMSWTTAGS